MRRTQLSFRSFVLCIASLLAASLAWAQSGSVVGIVEGGATLIRQTTRYTLAEGMALNEQDIIETAPGAFAQIELPGGVLVGIGESTRLMLRPRVGKGLAAPPLYLLQGWLKTTGNGSFGYASPIFELATQAASTVVYMSGAQYEVVVERGAAWLPLRVGAPAASPHAAGAFAQRREGATPTVARRAAPEFLAKVPRQFRDRLPSRAEQLAKRNVAPKALGEIAYADVAGWLRTEPALRLPLLPLWRSRAAADLSFRAAAKAELARHPEWEPYADPEGYARRLVEEAERRRAREAARQAARAAAAAAAAAAAGTGTGSGKP